MQLLPGVVRVTLLVTQQAREHAEAVRRRLTNLTVDIREHGLADTAEEQYALFRIVLDQLNAEGDAGIVLDTTQGLRNLPLVYLAASAFQEGREGLPFKGVYYSMFEHHQDDGVPVVDLSPTLAMQAWGRALERARLYADWRGVAERIATDIDQARADQSNSLAHRTRVMGEALRAGLPLEAGIKAMEIQRQLAPTLAPDARSTHRPPATFTAAAEPLGQLVAALATEGSKKGKLRLDRAELERQLRVATLLCDAEPSTAALVLREWLVSLAVLARGEPSRWLDRPERAAAERALHRASAPGQPGGATALARAWAAVTQRRNPLAHAGMKRDVVTAPPLDDVVRTCRDLLDLDLAELAPPESPHRVLVTPVGLSPGVLHTLLRLRGPFDACVLVTSMAARGGAEAALAQGGHTGGVRWVELADAVRPARPDRVVEASEESLADCFRWATEVVVNTSGGTSLLQHVVVALGRLAERAVHDLTWVRWVAAFDARPDGVSRDHPWTGGEVADLPPVFAAIPERSDR